MLPLAFYRETLHYKLTLTATLPEPVGARQFSLEGRRALLATYDNQPGIIPELFRKGYAWTPVVMLATAILLPLIALILALSGAHVWAHLVAKFSLMDAYMEIIMVALLIQSGFEAELMDGYFCFATYAVFFHTALVVWDEGTASARPERKPVDVPIERALVVAVVAVAFFTLFVAGITFPLAELEVTRTAVLQKIKDHFRKLPDSLKILAKVAGVTPENTADTVRLPKGEVSVMQTVVLLLSSKSMYTQFGSAILLVTVLIIPPVSMFCLVVGIFFAPRWKSFAETIRRFSMFDVLLGGVILFGLVSRELAEIEVTIGDGTYILAFAVIVFQSTFLIAPDVEEDVKEAIDDLEKEGGEA